MKTRQVQDLMVKYARENMKGDVETIPPMALWMFADQFHENDFVNPYKKNRSLTEDLNSTIEADNHVGLGLFRLICSRTTVNRNGSVYSFAYCDGDKVKTYLYKK